MWVLGKEVKLSGLVPGTLPSELAHWPGDQGKTPMTISCPYLDSVSTRWQENNPGWIKPKGTSLVQVNIPKAQHQSLSRNSLFKEYQQARERMTAGSRGPISQVTSLEGFEISSACLGLCHMAELIAVAHGMQCTDWLSWVPESGLRL